MLDGFVVDLMEAEPVFRVVIIVRGDPVVPPAT